MAASEAEPPPPKGAPMKKGLFYNPWRTWHEKSLSDVLRWTMERRQMKVSRTGFLMDNAFPSAAELAARFPVKRASRFAPLPHNSVEAVWVGHATVLARMRAGESATEVSFMTDPMFSSRCSPVQWAGPARIVPPAMQIEDLPSLDFVLISHNHYDHLDIGSVHRLHRRFGQSLRWYVPLGLKKWFNSEGISNVVELDWWQTVEHLSSPADSKKGTAATHISLAGQQADVTADSSIEKYTKTTVTMTPAQHWSVRGLADRYKSLWGSYCVVHKAKDASSGEADLRFWFAGDSGYCDAFKEIGQRLGPIDVSAIPIGAYKPAGS